MTALLSAGPWPLTHLARPTDLFFDGLGSTGGIIDLKATFTDCARDGLTMNGYLRYVLDVSVMGTSASVKRVWDGQVKFSGSVSAVVESFGLDGEWPANAVHTLRPGRAFDKASVALRNTRNEKPGNGSTQEGGLETESAAVPDVAALLEATLGAHARPVQALTDLTSPSVRAGTEVRLAIVGRAAGARRQRAVPGGEALLSTGLRSATDRVRADPDLEARAIRTDAGLWEAVLIIRA